MAGLMALQVFSLVPELKESNYARNAFETIDYHRRLGKSIYFFGRKRKFFTLKYPFIWYNALYITDVLSRFNFTKDTELMKCPCSIEQGHSFISNLVTSRSRYVCQYQSLDLWTALVLLFILDI